MKLSWFGRLALALFASLALGLGMTACGGGTIAYLWVLGQQYNQIAAFKVDDYTGNLTQVPHQPFSSDGSVPVMLVVKPGGRYVYVLNQGTGGGPTATVNGIKTCQAGQGGSLVEYSVGGDGTLNEEQIYTPQGCTPLYLQLDSTGTYLYELDKYSSSGDGLGGITAYSIDPTTGRLSQITNEASNPGGVNLPYWEVGASPLMMKTTGSCLYTVDSADQSIYPYSIGSGGQLVPETTGVFHPQATNITSINGNGTYVILTDAGANTVIPFTSNTSGCTLASLAGGPKQLAPDGTSNPVNSLISNSGNYLYVLDQSTTSTNSNQPYSGITGFLISQSNGLTELTGSPYQGGEGPVCMVEDPTNKWMYISNSNAGTITGKYFDANSGELSALPRGSSFAAAGEASCLAISGAVD